MKALSPLSLSLTLFAFFVTGTASAQPYYVAPTGSDASVGSAAAPWATLQHAADEVAAGDTVYVVDGAYVGFQIETSGTESNPVVFMAEGDNVVVDSVNPVRGDHIINVEGADYVVIDGFRVRDAEVAGIRAVVARGVVIRNNVVGPNGKWGIFTGFTPDLQVLDNVTFGSVIEHGIYVSNSEVAADNPIIRGNVSYGNGANGIQLNGDCHAGGDGVIEGALIERNVVYDNEHKGFSIISAPGARIQNNVTWGNGIGGAAGGIHLVDEPGCGQPTNDAVVVNNTLIEPNIAGIRMTDGATGNVIFNNLIVSGNPIADEVGSSHIDAASNMTRSSTVGLFLDAASHDYRLASGSDAIDAGMSSYQSEPAAPTDFDNVPRPLGSGHDVGAFEAAAPVAVRQPSHMSALALHAPAPNPFSTATTIRYELPVRRHVTVQLFDAMGRMVETLEDSEQAPGEHEVHLDGRGLADGIYFIRVRAGDEIMTRAIVRIR